jgi:hypothetical protein
MTVQISQGTALAIAATFNATKSMTAITNATEAVATFEASHGIVVNDIFEVSSGWGRLDKRVVRAKVVATNDVTLEGIDTSDTTLYPVGAGIGTIREIATWASINQVSDFNADAPSVDFIDITSLDDQTRKQIPGLESAPHITGSVLFDPALAYVATVLAASDKNALTPVRMITAAGNKIYGNAYWKMSRFPQVSIGQAIKNAINLTLASVATVYAS